MNNNLQSNQNNENIEIDSEMQQNTSICSNIQQNNSIHFIRTDYDDIENTSYLFNDSPHSSCNDSCENDCENNEDDDNDFENNNENNIYHNFDNDASDSIRAPDRVISECLMNDANIGNNDFSYDFDKQISDALKISKHIYDIQNNEEDIIRRSIEEYNEQLRNQNILEQSIMDERRKSLDFFLRRINSISFGNNNDLISSIQNSFNDYFNLSSDNIYLENDIYDETYKLIDSFYLIPKEKGYKKTAISKDEDELLRTLLLKNDKSI